MRKKLAKTPFLLVEIFHGIQSLVLNPVLRVMWEKIRCKYDVFLFLKVYWFYLLLFYCVFNYLDSYPIGKPKAPYAIFLPTFILSMIATL